MSTKQMIWKSFNLPCKNLPKTAYLLHSLFHFKEITNTILYFTREASYLEISKQLSCLTSKKIKMQMITKVPTGLTEIHCVSTTTCFFQNIPKKNILFLASQLEP